MITNDPVFVIALMSFIYLYIICGLGLVTYFYLNKDLPESTSEFTTCLYYGIISIPIIILYVLLMIFGLIMFTILFILIILISPLIYLIERIYTYIFYKIIYK